MRLLNSEKIPLSRLQNDYCELGLEVYIWIVTNDISLRILGYPKYVQWRFKLDCAKAQADLNLHLAHMSEDTFYDIVAQIFYEGQSRSSDNGFGTRKQ